MTTAQSLEISNQRWAAVLGRDPRFDHQFVYGVRSTGIYCRPSCPSRRPRREQVTFFGASLEAEQAGFRACHRCHPDRNGTSAQDVVARVCRYIEQNAERRVTLQELSRVSGYNAFHLQRLFKKTLGISPREYAAGHRLQDLKTRLRQGYNVTVATYEAGYGSSSRIYETANGRLGMTPATYGRGGAGMNIRYATAACPLGRVLVAATDRGVCAVQFGESDRQLQRELHDEFPAAEVRPAGADLRAWVQEVVNAVSGRQPHPGVPLDLQCTAFQRQVWETLLRIPFGSTRSYQQVAADIGQPKAARAVARACATNPVAVLIPCHRVVRGTGEMGGYRWGVERKEKLLQRERRASE
ncbi:MAG TPA: bifunctional DNA-binding transcriptional regulator/O6-methylguanine-DNA methyltransferase Ada [Terriglobales bacterium]|nr:bifunctional DNA-binding transcriptional regulator/O6-methylguanine-DNA methyltransferase Ada [Terriglobales bacterium]